MNQQMVIFEDSGFENLLPLVYWRAVFELRCGRDTLLDKIRMLFPDGQIGLCVRAELEAVTRVRLDLPVNSDIRAAGQQVLLINGRWLADKPLPRIPVDGALRCKGQILAANVSAQRFAEATAKGVSIDSLSAFTQSLQPVEATSDYSLINYPWDLVHANGRELVRQWRDQDAAVLGTVCEGVHLLNRSAIHIGPDAILKPGVVLDACDGPIYIDRGAVISPNVSVQGPCYIGGNCLIQPAAVIHADTSIGPVCKAGGEIEASIMHSHSNKQHHGFLGHSYVGQWVNCGAGMTNSDLKNTYGPVKVPINGRDVDSGLTFVGLTMGDHSKVGINAVFPTGAVVGFASNIFTATYPLRFVPSFSWVTDAGRVDFDPVKGLQIARRVMARRNVALLDEEEQLFLALPQISRRFEQQPNSRRSIQPGQPG